MNGLSSNEIVMLGGGASGVLAVTPQGMHVGARVASCVAQSWRWR
jgi:hypothetical protein